MILTLISTKMIFNILWIVLGVALVLFGADKLTEGACHLLTVDIIKSFVLAGVDVTMNQYNKLGKTPVWQKQTKQE